MKGETMKFTMTLKQIYDKAEKIIDIPLEPSDRMEIMGWLDAGYEVILKAIKEEGAKDDF